MTALLAVGATVLSAASLAAMGWSLRRSESRFNDHDHTEDR